MMDNEIHEEINETEEKNADENSEKDNCGEKKDGIEGENKETREERKNEKQEKTKHNKDQAISGPAAVFIIICMLVSFFLGRGSIPHITILKSKPSCADCYTAGQIYDMVNKSIVGITVTDKEGIISNASGVIYTSDGYIVTNDHIYKDETSPAFVVYTYDGHYYEGKYIGGDTRTDLAVLKIDAVGLAPAAFCNSEELVIGDNVYTVTKFGGPTNDAMLTKGIISSVNTRASVSTNYMSSFIQTDADINPGSSGGAAVNDYAQVIGIASSKMTGSEFDGINFIIPSKTVKRVVEDIIRTGTVSGRASLGISYSVINNTLAAYCGTVNGIVIEGIDKDGCLANTDVEVKDSIIAVNSKKITSYNDLLNILENMKAGDEIELTILKNGTNKKENIAVKLGEYKTVSSYKE